MISNMFSYEKKEYICYKCQRFFIKDYPLYKNLIYTKSKNINEIVTIDCELCQNLETTPQEVQLENIISKKDTLKRDEQLLFVSYLSEVPLEIKKYFEFAGYDIINNSSSLLTNTSNINLEQLIFESDLSSLGLLNDFHKAIKIKQELINITEDENIDVVLAYRITN